MTQRTPVFYDAANSVHRPMDAGDTVDPTTIQVSTYPGNRLQVLTAFGSQNGLYSGALTGTYYVNTATGADTVNNGSKAAPFKTIDYALSQVIGPSPDSLYRSNVTLALAAGQTYPLINDFNIYGGQIMFTFYGDPKYGDFNGPLVNGTTVPAFMSDLQRPIITPTASLVTGLNKLSGINRFAGNVVFSGVQINLPAAPSNPSISLYTGLSDMVRGVDGDARGYVQLDGAVVNITDPTAYWGFLGVQARSSSTELHQFASQFQVQGTLVSATSGSNAAQLACRKNFIKFYADYAGNNQQSIFLQTTATNSSSGSGLLDVTWSDTSALIVTGSTPCLASYPIAFDLNYGLNQYITNLIKSQSGVPLNFRSSRQI
ncbi:hypothetical protein [Ralstonia phage phiRSL1]|uniref:Uncharacterized protein n=1 Tax=Ralstonia phage phiRSL1 TaxID=1980924 RepID=B2ZY50_9CAUD|nr:hypothetical protein RSL1_ORF196 [Ralstonia phage phiRSL1]BAG41645.1 hypothetical protein [Ralstonia phage phiRSL1]